MKKTYLLFGRVFLALAAIFVMGGFLFTQHASAAAPLCNGLTATIYVEGGFIVSDIAADNGDAYIGTLSGDGSNDVIVGTSGNDIINASSGNNTICGLEGNDTITAGTGGDWVDAGDGNNTVSISSGINTVITGNGNNDITTGNSDDTITTGSGNDTINAGAGDNTINAGAGNNEITAGNNTDDITTGNGNDIIDAGAGTNTVNAGDGNNNINGGNNSDTITTGSGDDTIDVAAGTNIVDSGAGNDVIDGGSGADTFDAGTGYDFCSASTGSNTLLNCEVTGTTEGIIIAKEASPTGAQAFGFTGTLGSFSLTNDGASQNWAFFSPSTGSKTVTETAVVGWDLTSISCNDAGTTVNLGSNQAVIDYDNNEAIVCIFTNAQTSLASQTITVTTSAPASAEYGSTFPVAAMASSGLTVNITTTGGCSIASGTVTMTSSTAACVIHYNQAGNGSYDAAPEVTETTNATTRAITVTAIADARTYDSTPDSSVTPTITSGSLATGDTATWTQTFDTQDVGTGKTLTPSGTVNDGNSGNNYSVTFVNNTSGEITLRPITITADPKAKNFGDSDPALTYQITSGSLAGSDAFSGDLTRVAGEDIGDYQIQQGSVVLTSNYDLIYIAANLTIGTKTITVNAEAKSKTYGDFDPALTYTFSPALEGSDTFSGSLERATGEDVGTYAILIGSLSLGSNYSISFTGANFDISQKTLTITANDASKTYGDTTTFAGTEFTTSTLVSGDTVDSATITSTGAIASANVGTYDITIADAIGTGLTNYSITYINGTLTVNAKDITVTAVTDTKEYDGTIDSSLTPTITPDLVSGDTSGFIQTFDTKHRGFGNKTITPSGTVNDGNSGNNYNVTFASVTTGTITRRPITVTAVTNTKPYDGNVSAAAIPTITSGSLGTGDTAVWTETYNNSSVGIAKTLEATGTVNDGNSGDNYTITFQSNNTGVITDTSTPGGSSSSSSGSSGGGSAILFLGNTTTTPTPSPVPTPTPTPTTPNPAPAPAPAPESIPNPTPSPISGPIAQAPTPTPTPNPITSNNSPANNSPEVAVNPPTPEATPLPQIATNINNLPQTAALTTPTSIGSFLNWVQENWAWITLLLITIALVYWWWTQNQQGKVN